MLLCRLAFCSLLVSIPLLGHTQSTPTTTPLDPAPTYRWYVGVGAYTSQHEYLGSRYGQHFNFPVQLTLGYQFRPRLAVQVAVVSAGNKGSYDGLMVQPNGTLLPYSQTYRNRSTSLSALGRYTLTRTPAHRLQVDGLGGFTLHRQSFAGTGSFPDSREPDGLGSYDVHSRDTDVLLTIGASVRYRLSSHLEAMVDGTLSPSLRALRDITKAGALGLRYNFGYR